MELVSYTQELKDLAGSLIVMHLLAFRISFHVLTIIAQANDRPAETPQQASECSSSCVALDRQPDPPNLLLLLQVYVLFTPSSLNPQPQPGFTQAVLVTFTPTP